MTISGRYRRPPECPFPGIPAFEFRDAAVFSGRDTEVRELRKRLHLHRGMLLFAGSGVGKSSMLNAGVIPAMLDERFTPERIRVQPRPGQEFVVGRIAVAPAMDPLPSLLLAGSSDDRRVLSANELVSTLRGLDEATWPLLIFDQFEEWITLFEEDAPGAPAARERREAQANIRTAIGTLLGDRTLPVKVLLSLREDYLGRLAPLVAENPELASHYLRLDALSPEAVYAAIRDPFKRYPDFYHDEIPERLAERIREEFAARSGPGPVQLTEVQIVCRTLFEDAVAGAAAPPAPPDPDAPPDEAPAERTFRRRGGVAGILEQYFTTTLGQLGPDREPAIAILSQLVTSAGTRNVLPESTLFRLVAREEGIGEPALRTALRGLQDPSRFVRREQRQQVPYYEIASEFLVEPIRKVAAEREAQIARRKLREEFEREARDRRRRLRARAGWGIGVALLIVAVVGVVVGLKARAARDEARRLRADARAEMLATLANAALLEGMNERGALLARQSYLVGREGTGTALPRVDAALRAVLSDEFVGAPLGDLGSNDPRLAGGPGLIALTGREGIEVWTLAQQPVRRELDGRGGVAAISPDGAWLATGDSAGAIRVWMVDSLRRPQLTMRDPGALRSSAMAFAPDGRRLAVGDTSGVVRVYDRRAPRRPPLVLSGHAGRVWGLAFGAGSRLYSTDVTGTAIEWSLQTPAGARRRFGAVAVAAAPDGRTLAVADTATHIITLRSIAAPDRPLRTLSGHTGLVTQIAFSPDGAYLLSGGLDGAVRLWELADATSRPTWEGYHSGSGVIGVAFAGDAHTFASSTADGTTRLWRAAGQSRQRIRVARLAPRFEGAAMGGPGFVAGVGQPELFSSFDQGEPEGALRLWTGDRIHTLSDADWLPTVIAIGPDSQPALVAAAQGWLPTIRVWEATRPGVREQASLEMPDFDRPAALALARAGRLAAGGDEGTVIVWDLARRTVLLRDSLRDAVLALAFTPDGTRLAAGTARGRITIWEWRGDTARRTASVDGFTPVHLLRFAPGGSLLASAHGSAIRLWDLDAPDPSGRQLTGHDGWIGALAFSGDSAMLASGADDGTILLWHLDQDEPAPAALVGHLADVHALEFRSGEVLRSVGGEGIVFDWTLDPSRLADLICTRVQRNLTLEEWERFVGPDTTYARTCARFPVDQTLFAAAQDAALSNREAHARTLLTLAARDTAFDVDSVLAGYRALARGFRLLDLVDSSAYASRDSIRSLGTQLLALGAPPALIERGSDVAQRLLGIGEGDARIGEVDAALWAYDAATTLAGPDAVTASQWNNLCWFGSTWKRHPDVRAACDRAVELDPTDPQILDSRGLARALAGDHAGAVEDFRAFAESRAMDAADRAVRRRWIESLRAGRNPFTDTVLAGLRR